jgi:hypothetical protein
LIYGGGACLVNTIGNTSSPAAAVSTITSPTAIAAVAAFAYVANVPGGTESTVAPVATNATGAASTTCAAAPGNQLVAGKGKPIGRNQEYGKRPACRCAPCACGSGTASAASTTATVTRAVNNKDAFLATTATASATPVAGSSATPGVTIISQPEAAYY